MITEQQFYAYGRIIEQLNGDTGESDPDRHRRAWQHALNTSVTLPDGRVTTFKQCTKDDLLAITAAMREFVARKDEEINNLTDRYLAKHEPLWESEGPAL
ncbi:hypothetical protein [Geodermatophilus sp. URMC 62]|uniref:hypothetical protein n=1 Tax=Geodermatophilus sp. URMC 62 TaxID=3423414 RepID=UPI00406C7808